MAIWGGGDPVGSFVAVSFLRAENWFVLGLFEYRAGGVRDIAGRRMVRLPSQDDDQSPPTRGQLTADMRDV